MQQQAEYMALIFCQSAVEMDQGPLYSIGERGITLHLDKPLNAVPAVWCLLSTPRVECSKLREQIYRLSVNHDRVTSANLCSIQQQQLVTAAPQLLLHKMHLSQCTLQLRQAALLHFADCDNAMQSSPAMTEQRSTGQAAKCGAVSRHCKR